MDITLTGRTALITGGARGICTSVSRIFAKAGARVAILDQKREAAAVVADEINAENGIAVALGASVDDFAQMEAAASAASQPNGGIDILVTCAGTTSRFGVDELTAEEWSRIVEINLNGVFYSVKAVLPHLRRSGGSIILIGSAAIVAGSGGGVHYAASKAGLEGLCRGLTRELGPQGVRTNLIHPSLIDTELLRLRHPDPALRRELAEAVPLRRLGQPEDIAYLAAFLASDLAGYITGQSFYVDGGRTFCK